LRNDKLSIVYRRKDGDYGMIVPEDTYAGVSRSEAGLNGGA
jgi:hypothetical protein